MYDSYNDGPGLKNFLEFIAQYLFTTPISVRIDYQGQIF